MDGEPKGGAMMSKSIGLLFWLGIVFAAAAVGGLASVESASFYKELARPSWAPPGWLFGPVWTTLYAMMAVAAWLVWRERGFRGGLVPLSLFIDQLVLNVLWTWIFFVWRQGMWAFVEILVLWALIVAMMKAFRAVRPLAAWLLAPYLAWTTFAAALAFAVWRMNPALLG